MDPFDRGRRDRGMSLVEVLVAVVLLGTVGVAVLGAMAAVARGAGIHRDVASLQAAVASAGAEMGATSTAYESCATAADYPLSGTAAMLNDKPITVSVTRVRHWNETTWVDTCAEDALQLVTIEARRGERGATLEVVKAPPPPASIAFAPVDPVGQVDLMPTPCIDGCP